jgi:hypothetical protein
MQQHRIWFARGRGAWWWAAPWALGVALAACSSESDCDLNSCPTCSCDPLAEALAETLNEDSDVPCGSLREGTCQRSGHCIMDSICVAPACSGPECNDRCEIVRACVPY